MIKIHESYFFLIIFLTILITYVLFTIYQNCDINCKVHFYKYENYHTSQVEDITTKKNEPIFKSKEIEDIYENEFSSENNIKKQVNQIGSRTSAHSAGLQGSEINKNSSEEYLSKLLNIPY